MTYPDAIQFLYDLRWFGAKFGLANTFKLAALAGNPQEKLRFIHVAGTNGKGSTCAMLESIYRAVGLRVGLFTSPHLVAFGERIQVNRRLIPKTEIVRLVREMRELLKQGWGDGAPSAKPAQSDTAHGAPTLVGLAHPEITGTSPDTGRPKPNESGALGAVGERAIADHPTFFEVVALMALRYFAEQKCDVVLWETGLGGRLDATNIVTPLASVITNIQYDHQKWLGETLASIAAEKAGIIKPGIPVITGADAPEALEVISAKAREQNAVLTLVEAWEMRQPPLDTLELPLLGQHQRMNAAVALATVRALRSNLPVSGEAIKTGLSRVDWPGRFQLVARPSGQRILLDGAHNIGGVQTLATALRQYFPKLVRAWADGQPPSTRPALILGILRDKDWPAMCEVLAPLAGRILLVPVHSERTAEPHGLAEVCHAANPKAQVAEFSTLSDALASTARDGFVVIAGSLYLIGEAMELLQLSPAKPRSERGLNEWSMHVPVSA